MTPSPDLLDRLLSAEGRALLDGLPDGPLGPEEALRVGTRLRRTPPGGGWWRPPWPSTSCGRGRRPSSRRRRGCGSPARGWSRPRPSRWPGTGRPATPGSRWWPTCAAGSGATCARSPPGGPPWPWTATRSTSGWPGRTPASTGPASSRPPAPTCATCACPGRWRCSSTRPGGPAAGACRRGRAARRWPGAWSWRAGSRPSASRPPPASHSAWSPTAGRWSCWPTGGSSRRPSCGRRRWPPPPAGPPSSPAPTP